MAVSGKGHASVTVFDWESDSFDAAFAAEATRIVKSPGRAPRAYAICERAIGTLRREHLDRTLILGRHLQAVLAEYVEHYNAHRPSVSQPACAVRARHGSYAHR